MKLIYTTKVQDIGEHILVCKEGRKGFFHVKLYYNSLYAKTRMEFPTKEIWCSHALRSHSFTQEAVLGKIITIDMLMKR